MITSLLKQAYSSDIELWAENGKLKYRAEAGMLTDEVKQKLVDNKETLIRRLEQNLAAKNDQWIVFEFGEMYNKRLGVTSDLFILRNDDETFNVWRATWRTGDPTPSKESTIVRKVPFAEAFARAVNYYEWSTNGKSKKKKAG